MEGRSEKRELEQGERKAVIGEGPPLLRGRRKVRCPVECRSHCCFRRDRSVGCRIFIHDQIKGKLRRIG